MLKLAERSEQARAQLIQRLRVTGAIRSERIARAFFATPRETFVTRFFDQERFEWIPRTAEQYDVDQWIEAIYRDEPLVTWIDACNRPGSSSSAPTVMAMMLEALDPQPGHRVLEIGTGSGYNAALLAFLVEDPHLVTTIEVEEALAQNAKGVLEATVGPVSVQIGNGYEGVPLYAPYDRIIVTASSSIIPHTWYEQLAPNGRLIMDLQGSLRKSGFLVIEKNGVGSACGRFDPRYLYFMPMRSGHPALSPVKKLLQQTAIQRIILEDDATTNILFDDTNFHWFLQWGIPGITLSKARMKEKHGTLSIPLVTFVDPEEKTIIQLSLRDSKWSGYERGNGGLWDAIIETFHEWNAMGRPDQATYYVEWSQQDACFQLICEQGMIKRSFNLQ